MKEIKGNAFDLISNNTYDGLCITTNGIVKNNGALVMGRGIALEIKNHIRGVDYLLGRKVQKSGNRVFNMGMLDNVRVMSFPTKYDWKDISSIELIRESCVQLMAYINHYNLNNVLLPRPGCSSGKLNWADVKAAIEPLLDDRVTVISQ